MSTTDIRKILEAVLAVQLRDEDGNTPTVADALPDALFKQAKAATSGSIEVPSLVICRMCKRAFIPAPGMTMRDTLPCGHTLSAWFTANLICEFKPGQGQDDCQDEEA